MTPSTAEGATILQGASGQRYRWHAWKTGPLLVAVLSLVWGCTGSTRDVTSPAGFAGPSSPPEPAAPQVQPAPRTPPRPIVYFTGEFTRTGRYAWTNGMTLKDGIDMAGGFTQWANGKLRLIHRDGSRELYRFGRGKPLTSNPALQPEDLVFSGGEVCVLY